jgi:hypothetical protein
VILAVIFLCIVCTCHGRDALTRRRPTAGAGPATRWWRQRREQQVAEAEESGGMELPLPVELMMRRTQLLEHVHSWDVMADGSKQIVSTKTVCQIFATEESLAATYRSGDGAPEEEEREEQEEESLPDDQPPQPLPVTVEMLSYYDIPGGGGGGGGGPCFEEQSVLSCWFRGEPGALEPAAAATGSGATGSHKPATPGGGGGKSLLPRV